MVWKYLFGSDEEKKEAPKESAEKQPTPEKTSSGFWNTDKGEVKGESTEAPVEVTLGENFVPAPEQPLKVDDLSSEEGGILTVGDAPAGEQVSTEALPEPTPESSIGDLIIHESGVSETPPTEATADVTTELHLKDNQNSVEPAVIEGAKTEVDTATAEPKKEEDSTEDRPVFSAERDMTVMPSMGEEPKTEEPSTEQSKEHTVLNAAAQLVKDQEKLLADAQDYLRRVQEVHKHTIEHNEKRQATLAEITGRHDTEKDALTKRHQAEFADLDAKHSRELAEATSAAATSAKRVEQLAATEKRAQQAVDTYTQQTDYMKNNENDAEKITEDIEHGADMAEAA